MATIKVGFWNLRRLGGGTSVEKASYYKDTIERLGADITILCELTSGAKGGAAFLPTAQNITYRVKNSAQLCYGCLDSAGADVALTRYTPKATAEYKAAQLSTNNNFTTLVDRGVAQVTVTSGGSTLQIYGFHAPSGQPALATAAASFVCSDLKTNAAASGDKWLFLGDMNVEPEDYLTISKGAFLSADVDMVSSGSATYHGSVADKEFDFAFTNVAGATINNLRRSARASNGDHNPFLISCPI